MSPSTPRDAVRPLLQVRQNREFASEPVDAETLHAIADVARWSGSSANTQPWRFILISDPETLRAIAEAGEPSTRALGSAPAAIAVVMPQKDGGGISLAFDEGRAAERILVAASLLDLGAGISWVKSEVREAVASILDLPGDHFVRTIVAIGHPTESGARPKSKRGEARLPREETVFEERWPG